MGSLFFWLLLGSGLMATTQGSGVDADDGSEAQNAEDEVPQTPPNGEDGPILEGDDTPQDDPDGEEIVDPGAAVSFDGNTITINVDEEETGSVVGIRSAADMVLSPACCSGGTDYGVNFYLVPEGVDFPPTPTEVIAEHPELDENGIGKLDYDDYFANIGLEPIATIDLGSYQSIGDDESVAPDVIRDTRPDDLEIVSNADFELLGFYSADSGHIGDDDFAPLEDIAEPATEWEDDWPSDASPDAFLDTGATVDVDPDTGGITLDVGDDETGHIVALRSDVDNSGETDYSARSMQYQMDFYLVPEGMDFPPSVDEVAAANPDIETFPFDDSVQMDRLDYMDNLGLEPIASLDLGSYSYEGLAFLQGTQDAPDVSDTRAPDLTIASNQPFEYVTLDVYRSGFVNNDDFSEPAEIAAGQYQLANWASEAPTDLGAGDDVLNALDFERDGGVINGGDGNDTLSAHDPNQNNVVLNGGAGDDLLSVFGTNVANGGDGADRLTAEYEGVAYGDAGDDLIRVATLSEGYGGAGNDTLALDNSLYDTNYDNENDGALVIDVTRGLAAYGGAGDDVLQFAGDMVGVIDGGTGNDLFDMRDTGSAPNIYSGDPAALNITGGEGSDTFLLTTFDDPIDVEISGGDGVDTFAFDASSGYFNTESRIVEITDFDLATEVLAFAASNPATDSIDIQTDDAGTGTLITIQNDPSEFTVHLPNVLGITLDDIALIDSLDDAIPHA